MSPFFPSSSKILSPFDPNVQTAYAHVVHKAVLKLLDSQSPPGASARNPISLLSPSPSPAATGDTISVNLKDVLVPVEYEIPRGPMGNRIVVVPVPTPVALWRQVPLSASAPPIAAPPPAASPAPSDSSTDDSILDDLPPFPEYGIGDIDPIEIRRRTDEYMAAREECRAASTAIKAAKAAMKVARMRRAAAHKRKREKMHLYLEIMHEVSNVDIRAPYESSDPPESPHHSSPGLSVASRGNQEAKNDRQKSKQARKTSVTRKGRATRRATVTRKRKATQRATVTRKGKAAHRATVSRKGKEVQRATGSTPPPDSGEEEGIGSDYEAPVSLHPDISAQYIGIHFDEAGPSISTEIRHTTILAESRAKQARKRTEFPENIRKRKRSASDTSPEY